MTAVFVIAASLFGSLAVYGFLTAGGVSGVASRDPYAPARWRWRATANVLVLLAIAGLWFWISDQPLKLDSVHAFAAARAILLAPTGT